MVGLLPVGTEARRGFPQFVQPEFSLGERISLLGEALWGPLRENAAAAAGAVGEADCGWWDRLWFGCEDGTQEAVPETAEGGVSPVVPASGAGTSAASAPTQNYFLDERVIERVVVREEALDPTIGRALLERLGLLEAEVSRFDSRIDAARESTALVGRRAGDRAEQDADEAAAAAVSGGSADASFGTLAVTGSATSTFGSGLDIDDGCFAIDGTCIDLDGNGIGFSTTSADYWETGQARWATTSTDYWEGTQIRWATTSSDYWESTKSRWATSSSAYWLTTIDADDLANGTTNRYYADSLVAAYISGSSTVPHIGGSAYGDVLYWTGSAWSRTATSTLGIDSSQWDDATGGVNYASGNVGIGTSTPYAKLSVAGPVVAEYFHATSTTATSTFLGAFSVGSTTPPSASMLSVGTSSPLLTVSNSSGYVGVGTAAPTSKFHIVGRNSQIKVEDTTSNSSSIALRTGSVDFSITDTVGLVTFAGGAGDGANLVLNASDQTDQLYLKTGGNVGIGTSTPYARLSVAGQVVGSHFAATTTATSTFGGPLDIAGDFNTSAGTIRTAGTIRITNTGGFQGSVGNVSAPGFSFSVDTNTGVYRPTSDNLGFVVGGTEALRVTTNGSGGLIGIGTSTPYAKLSIHGLNGETAAALFAVASSTAAATTTHFAVSNAGAVYVGSLAGGATNVTTDANGNIIRDPSDASLKENVTAVISADALEKVLALRGVTFDWRDQEKYGPQRELGFIAQEVQDVIPEAVSSGGEYLSLSVKPIVAVLVEAVKEVWGVVEDLSVKVGTLMSWFAGDGSRLEVQGDVCVDGVCVTKEQFRGILEGAGAASATDSDESDEPDEPDEPPADEGAGDGDGSGSSAGDEGSAGDLEADSGEDSDTPTGGDAPGDEEGDGSAADGDPSAGTAATTPDDPGDGSSDSSSAGDSSDAGSSPAPSAPPNSGDEDSGSGDSADTGA